MGGCLSLSWNLHWNLWEVRRRFHGKGELCQEEIERETDGASGGYEREETYARDKLPLHSRNVSLSYEESVVRSLFEVDGQWLTFPFPFVHHQPLHIYVLALVIEDRF